MGRRGRRGFCFDGCSAAPGLVEAWFSLARASLLLPRRARWVGRTGRPLPRHSGRRGDPMIHVMLPVQYLRQAGVRVTEPQKRLMLAVLQTVVEDCWGSVYRRAAGFGAP